MSILPTFKGRYKDSSFQCYPEGISANTEHSTGSRFRLLTNLSAQRCAALYLLDYTREIVFSGIRNNVFQISRHIYHTTVRHTFRTCYIDVWALQKWFRFQSVFMLVKATISHQIFHRTISIWIWINHISPICAMTPAGTTIWNRSKIEPLFLLEGRHVTILRCNSS